MLCVWELSRTKGTVFELFFPPLLFDDDERKVMICFCVRVAWI